jgi:methionine synthase II (cobalamin-independent)
MKINTPSYVLAMPYEHFMTKALGSKFEKCQSNMMNLIDIENDIVNYGLPSRKNQVQAIKKNMEKAFKVYLKINLGNYTELAIQICYDEFQNMKDSESLLKVINEVLILTSKSES